MFVLSLKNYSVTIVLTKQFKTVYSLVKDSLDLRSHFTLLKSSTSGIKGDQVRVECTYLRVIDLNILASGY